jgi:glycosyltransferase involved in cell wall biosynthesis
MRILFVLPGLHRYNRGAEIAFTSIAAELAHAGEIVTLIGSGEDRPGTPYRFLHAASIRRENFESFPSIPPLRSEYAYEELSFVPDLLRQYRPSEYDVTVGCSYPFTNWVLRRPSFGGSRPPHVFVTQNGDWPARMQNSEYRYFGCEGLVCINPEYYERHRHRWRCRLIPNGVDCGRFSPGAARPGEFGLPSNRLIVLMVSALIPSKRVSLAIEAVSHIPDAHLAVAGDGALRQSIDAAAAKLLPGRFTRLSVAPEKMAALYRSANVFLHLSREEPFGISFVEAMASGLPIVAHDSSRSRYIVGDDEFLLDTEDPIAIAQQIERARKASPIRSKERSTKAAGFSWINIARMYRDFLQEVVISRK